MRRMHRRGQKRNGPQAQRCSLGPVWLAAGIHGAADSRVRYLAMELRGTGADLTITSMQVLENPDI